DLSAQRPFFADIDCKLPVGFRRTAMSQVNGAGAGPGRPPAEDMPVRHVPARRVEALLHAVPRLVEEVAGCGGDTPDIRLTLACGEIDRQTIADRDGDGSAMVGHSQNDGVAWSTRRGEPLSLGR